MSAPDDTLAPVSVIIAGSGDHLDELHRSIGSVSSPPIDDVEIVVAALDHAAAIAAGKLDRVRTVDARGRSRGEAMQLAARVARGRVVMWLDETSVLTDGAIDVLVAAIESGADVAYGDHVVDGARPTRAFPPEFSPERLRAQHYLGPVIAATNSAAASIADPTAGIRGAEFHDLALRLAEVADRIDRVPGVLATIPHERSPSAADAHRRVVAAHCARMGLDAEIEPTGVDGVVRLRRRLSSAPTISVIVPTRGSSGDVLGAERVFVVEAVRSLVETSSFRPTEFVVVYDTATPDAVLDDLRRLAGDCLVLVEFTEPFNFSAKINAGVEASSSELLLLLNDDTELIEPTSLETMASHLQVADVGMVGAKLLFEDGTLQHGGHVYASSIHHACFGWPGGHPGPTPLVPLAVDRECSGVTAAVALVRRSVFDEVGGFDAGFPLNYNDVDFSLRVRASGRRVIWTPHATWFHFESRTRVSALRPDEVERITTRWGHVLGHDPYYHPDLSPDTGDWTPAVAPAEPAESDDEIDPTPAFWRERIVSTVLGPPPARPRGVNLVGYLDATSGLGERARQLGSVLEHAGIRHSRWSLDLTDSERRPTDPVPRADDGVVFDTTIAVVTALAFPGIEGAFPGLVGDVDRVVGYWFWELDHVPDTHRAAIDLVDEIWAPTEFVRQAYATAADVPVELVPLPIGRPASSGATRDELGLPNDAVVFLTSFDHLSSIERKNPHGVIDAFRQAFPVGEESVRLVVKSINGDRRPAAAALLADLAVGDDRIDCRDGYLDPGDQAALIEAADALVSLHRSEGLGLHIAEAMWLGTPVIATAYSGSVDLTAAGDDGPVAVEIDAELVPVVDGGEAYRSGRWAAPDLAQAAAAMRRIAAREPEVAQQTERAFARMQRQSDDDRAARFVTAALDARARPRSRRERVSGIARQAERAVRGAVHRATHGRRSTD